MRGGDLLRRCLREPLVHFGAAGVAIFALHARVAARPEGDRIVVSAAFVEGLAREQAQRSGRAPTPEETRALVDRFVEEEVLVREAVALGLDRGDPIVRRRLAQKMAFVAEDEAALREPTDADLAGYLDAHPERYREAPRMSFQHVFFSREKRGDGAAAEATRALSDLGAGAAPDGRGDPFLRGSAFARRTQAEIEAAFGRAFADAIGAAPVGAWAGPFASSYGVHLVRVGERVEGAMPPLSAARARVRQDLLDERREAARRALVDRLRARHRVEIETPAEARR